VPLVVEVGRGGACHRDGGGSKKGLCSSGLKAASRRLSLSLALSVHSDTRKRRPSETTAAEYIRKTTTLKFKSSEKGWPNL